VTVLVTGAAGFIGARMLQWLQTRGVQARGWTRATVDLLQAAQVASALRELQPSTILHLAARPVGRLDDLWTVPADEAAMLRHLIDCMPPSATLVYTGSMAEYGSSGCLDEHLSCSPATSYGFSKLCATQLALATRVTRQLDVRVARLFGVYGPGEGPSRLFPFLVSRLVRGEPVPLSDGLQVRDFVHVDDVCAALWAYAMQSDRPPPVVNIGSGVGVSVRAACEAVADELGVDRNLLRFGAVARRSVDEPCLIASTERLSRICVVPPPLLPLRRDRGHAYITELAAAAEGS
jgi:nucleoside-diphosphate-sugar epimerase